MYAELQVTSNFSFLRGASHPDELALTAAALGHRAVAITDRNTLAGIVRAHAAAKETGIRLVVGARLDLTDGPSLLCFPVDRKAYGDLAHLLTIGKRRTEKGKCLLRQEDVFEWGDDQMVAAVPPVRLDAGFAAHLGKLKHRFGKRLSLVASHLYRGDDAARLARLGDLADSLGVALLAGNDVHYHAPERRVLQDVLTCVREGCTIHDAGTRLYANAERHLKPAAEMARLFRRRPDALRRTIEIADTCGFSLDELRYEYPAEPVPDGSTPQEELERLTWIGVGRHYPHGVPEHIRALLEKELTLVAELGYAPYFLTVHDIVRFAKSRDILCQGRGSAANSAICYYLGITAVDPARIDLLFERFVSAERKEPPDIDVDFEHERREEVIQYIYEKYGRDRAGLAATVISYRPRSAIRDVGKALGLSPDTVDALSKSLSGWGRSGIDDAHVREAGFDPADRTLKLALALSRELIGFPRHLSQHVGGFVITRGLLSESVPIENAAMEDRTVIEWDKDDLDELGMLKIDVLALGMLTCLRKGFALLARHHGVKMTLGGPPQDDDKVYDMLCRGDSIGVFQVESRAQMSMLPRLKPRSFYDLVIEVAIVRPGPIQGDMVHPYLRRRDGKDPVNFPSAALERVLGKTMGVPLFQEQAMQIAIVAAGFAPAEADRLRRAMATFKRNGDVHRFRDRFIEGMLRNGYEPDFAERCFKQIEGFGSYGFPESHAASFALLVYDSAWMKCHYPAAFACALLNSQPMGFYAPAQIVRDARDHGVETRAVDVNASDWDCTLEPLPGHGSGQGRGPALRLGFRQVKGLAEKDAKMLIEHRGEGYRTLRELWRRSGLTRRPLQALAAADAFGSLGLDRRAAFWQVRGLRDAPLPLFAHAEDNAPRGSNAPPPELGNEPAVRLPAMPLGQQVIEDYAMLGMSLKKHPAALLRSRLTKRGIVPSGHLGRVGDGERTTVAGLVLVRQRPGTASGVIFVTLEDETGIVNIIVWPKVFERFRRTLLASRLLGVRGKLQREGLVVHVIAERLIGLDDELAQLGTIDREDVEGAFEHATARADEVRKPGRERSDILRKPRAAIPARAAMPEGRNFR
ncbi:MAG TPA: error-prone DNA polymerase [Candidatus Cybelea sp.]|nr:error-prone DNA polymerase [Candidatus Cybelea sp.]